MSPQKKTAKKQTVFLLSSAAFAKKVAGGLDKKETQVVLLAGEHSIFKQVSGAKDQALVVVVAEREKDITSASLCIGAALGHKKPLLVLFSKKLKLPTALGKVLKEQKTQLELCVYKDSKEALAAINKFVQTKHRANRRRFDINLRHDLYDFVSAEARKNGISRSEMVRRILAS